MDLTVNSYLRRPQNLNVHVSISSSDFETLSKLNAFKSLKEIVKNWVFIFLIVIVSSKLDLWYVTLLGLVLIATRQHALLVLLHDGVHGLLSPSNKINDAMSNWLISIYFLFPFKTYRLVHNHHHRTVNSPEDPDLIFKRGKWIFPNTKSFVLILYFTCLLGLSVLPRRVKNWIGNLLAIPNNFKKDPLFTGLNILSYLLLIIILSFFNLWKFAFFYWFLPMYTFLQLIGCVREIAEHSALPNQHDLNFSRNYICGRAESFFFAPYNVYLHLDHHLFPRIPFYNLPKLHAKLSENETYRKSAHISSAGLFSFKNRNSVWNEITKP